MILSTACFLMIMFSEMHWNQQISISSIYLKYNWELHCSWYKPLRHGKLGQQDLWSDSAQSSYDHIFFPLARADQGSKNLFFFVYVQTLQYLQQNAKERAELAANAATSVSTNFSIPSSTSKISLQELEELRKQLGSVTANSSVQQVLSLPKLWAQSLSLLLMCIVVFLSFII